MNKRGGMEKSKNFGQSIKRLFSELRSFRVLILVALIFAVSGSILSIVAPNKLSKLTDTISSGLVVNQEKFEIIANSINESLTSIDVNSVISSYKLNDLEKQEFLSVMTGSDGKSNEEFISELMGLSENTLGIILPNIKIDNIEINTLDQLELLDVLSSIDDKASASVIYKKIDECPESIREAIKPFMDLEKVKRIAIFLGCLYLLSALLNFFQGIINLYRNSISKFSSEIIRNYCHNNTLKEI